MSKDKKVENILKADWFFNKNLILKINKFIWK